MTVVRAAIIGLSWIGADPAGPASHRLLGTATPYSHASAYAASDGIDVVAVHDLSLSAMTDFVERWAPTWPQIATAATLDDLFDHDPELVSIVVPDHLHAPMLRRCLAERIPMVFTEKPFTTSLDEADELLAAIAAGDTTVLVNHTWRWRADMMEARRVIRSDEFGPVDSVTIEAGGPRAMLFRNLSHFLDLAVFLADDQPVWVSAELEGVGDDYDSAYQGDGGTDPALDPGARVVIGFAGGAQAVVSGRKASSSDVFISASCAAGRVVIDTLGGRIIDAPRPDGGTPTGQRPPSVRPLVPRSTVSGMQAAVQHLVDARRTGRPVEETGAQAGRTVVAIIDAALRSHAAASRKVAVT